MMSKLSRLALVFVAATVFVGGCEQKEEGPAEQVGKEIDKAVAETGKAMQDLGKQVEDSAKKDEQAH